MNREEIIKLARALCTDFKCESDTMVDFCNSIIRELEQEPVIEPLERLAESASKTAKALERLDVLDKIRAEIEQTPTVIWEENKKAYIFASYYKKQVLEIIDKYRKE